MLFQNAHAAVETQRTEPLRDHHGAGGGVLREQFGDGGLKGSSLLARGRSAGVCAGESRYFLMVRQPICRCCSILRMGQRSDQ